MMKEKTLIIAEAGVNHNGQIDFAKKLVDAAKDSGADIVKFQSFNANLITTEYAQKAEYQKKVNTDENQFEMLRKLELSEKDTEELNEYCKRRNIEFLSTAFDHNSLDLLKRMKPKRWKIPSGEITNLPYIREIAKQNGEVLIDWDG